MQKDFTVSQMQRWITNFTADEKLPFVTSSALISLPDLEAFVQKIKSQQADSVRIYFIRFSDNDIPTAKKEINGKIAEGCHWHKASDTFTQATVALVPARGFAHDDEFIFTANDIVVGDSVSTLMPGIVDEGTGLNPPRSSVKSNMIG